MNYNDWRAYFESNQFHFEDIDWSGTDNLTDVEKNLIKTSLQQFQKGENSEGKHLFAYAKTFPDPIYLECIRLFIREEQNHAKVLGKYMDIHSIPRIKSHWVDQVFRKLRIISGLETTISVLLVAEIIAKVYYKGLANAVSSSLLRKICNQILKDEDIHISFQCYTLHTFSKGKSPIRRFAYRFIHLTLILGTIVVVWFCHKNVLRKGGFSFDRFIRDTLNVFFEASYSIKHGVQESSNLLIPVRL